MVMRKTIKKARTCTMQTEINGTLHSMKNCSLNLLKLTNRTAFSEIFEFKGAFHSIKLKFRCQFLEISMGERNRLFQCEKRQAEQLCSLGIFQWFLGLNRKQNTDTDVDTAKSQEYSKVPRIFRPPPWFSPTTNTLAQILISPVDSSAKTTFCV